MSITRRTFIQGAMLGLSAAPAFMPLKRISRFNHRRLAVDRIMFDERRHHSLAFAEAARRFGATAVALCGETRGDFVQALFADARARKTAIGGLTSIPAFFHLQALAADLGIHPILRIHHRLRDDQDVHEAFGTPTFRAVCGLRLSDRSGSWPQEAAHLSMHLPSEQADASRHGDNLDEANCSVLAAKAMVTWVMA